MMMMLCIICWKKELILSSIRLLLISVIISILSNVLNRELWLLESVVLLIMIVVMMLNFRLFVVFVLLELRCVVNKMLVIVVNNFERVKIRMCIWWMLMLYNCVVVVLLLMVKIECLKVVLWLMNINSVNNIIMISVDIGILRNCLFS